MAGASENCMVWILQIHQIHVFLQSIVEKMLSSKKRLQSQLADCWLTQSYRASIAIHCISKLKSVRVCEHNVSIMLSYPLPRIGKSLEKCQFDKTCDISLLLIGRRVRCDHHCRLPPTQQWLQLLRRFLRQPSDEKVKSVTLQQKCSIEQYLILIKCLYCKITIIKIDIFCWICFHFGGGIRCWWNRD